MIGIRGRRTRLPGGTRSKSKNANTPPSEIADYPQVYSVDMLATLGELRGISGGVKNMTNYWNTPPHWTEEDLTWDLNRHQTGHSSSADLQSPLLL